MNTVIREWILNPQVFFFSAGSFIFGLIFGSHFFYPILRSEENESRFDYSYEFLFESPKAFVLTLGLVLALVCFSIVSFGDPSWISGWQLISIMSSSLIVGVVTAYPIIWKRTFKWRSASLDQVSGFKRKQQKNARVYSFAISILFISMAAIFAFFHKLNLGYGEFLFFCLTASTLFIVRLAFRKFVNGFSLRNVVIFTMLKISLVGIFLEFVSEVVSKEMLFSASILCAGTLVFFDTWADSIIAKEEEKKVAKPTLTVVSQ